MDIIQFSCPDPTVAATLMTDINGIVNEWARLSWLTNDPRYNTALFSTAQWQAMASTPTTYWCDYDAVYNNLGDSGRAVSDMLVGTTAQAGYMTQHPLVPSLAGTQLQLLNVTDLVAAGYMAAPIPAATSETAAISTVQITSL